MPFASHVAKLICAETSPSCSAFEIAPYNANAAYPRSPLTPATSAEFTLGAVLPFLISGFSRNRENLVPVFCCGSGIGIEIDVAQECQAANLEAADRSG